MSNIQGYASFDRLDILQHINAAEEHYYNAFASLKERAIVAETYNLRVDRNYSGLFDRITRYFYPIKYLPNRQQAEAHVEKLLEQGYWLIVENKQLLLFTGIGSYHQQIVDNLREVRKLKKLVEATDKREVFLNSDAAKLIFR